MTSNHRDEELLDNSPTDELPVLSEIDVIDEFERTAVFHVLDEGTARIAVPQPDEGTARLPRPQPDKAPPSPPEDAADDSTGRFLRPQRPAPSDAAALEPAVSVAKADAAGARGLERSGAARSARADAELRIRQLSKQVEAMSAEARRAAAALADRDATIASLEERLTATRDAVVRRDELQRQLRAELAERDARQAGADAALERQVAAAAERERAAQRREAELAEREARLADCESALEELERELTDKRAALETREADIRTREVEIEPRESALAAREDTVDAREASVSALVAREVQALHRARDRLAERIEAQHKAYAAIEERIERAARSDAADKDRSLRAQLARSREHAAALESYIEGRRARWRDMETRLAEQQTRIEELAVELEQRAERQQQAQQIAEAESRRVADLKAEVAGLRRLVESRRTAAADMPPVSPPPAEAAAPVDDGIEAVAAERDALRARLDSAQATLRRLERMLVERDRKLESTDQRPMPPHREDQDHGATLPGGTPLPPLLAQPSRREYQAPALLCLTGDAPDSFPLNRKSVVIGRGAGCDIQIATHFVSREHARLTPGPDGIDIEDLGSKNGVFVNAVRVERETLRHGDLVTVGESQFRFVAE